ncbi:unnamed protein product [Adineta ricciae]|uniref:Uncharacterized protein n=1 Tax=Adineta ricciae TaxID=249248 RepID=A0A813MLB7_ADIRI|nr:unnamed protein product [Adineta ricciae]
MSTARGVRHQQTNIFTRVIMFNISPGKISKDKRQRKKRLRLLWKNHERDHFTLTSYINHHANQRDSTDTHISLHGCQSHKLCSSIVRK